MTYLTGFLVPAYRGTSQPAGCLFWVGFCRLPQNHERPPGADTFEKLVNLDAEFFC
jgi:hypothetical protein